MTFLFGTWFGGSGVRQGDDNTYIKIQNQGVVRESEVSLGLWGILTLTEDGQALFQGMAVRS